MTKWLYWNFVYSQKSNEFTCLEKVINLNFILTNQ